MAARSIKLEVIVDDKGTIKVIEFARKIEKIGLASQKTKNELQGLSKELKYLQYRAASLTKNFLKLASIGGIIGGLGFGKVASDVIRVSASFEKLEKMLVTLTSDSEEARKALDWIVDFGSLTYGIDAVADAFVKLKSAGIDPTNGSLKALVEALMSYGKTSEDLKLAAIAIQQMAGKGVVSMEELRGQLAERIPDAVQIMASSLGLSQKEFEKLVSQGVIPAKEAIEALIHGLQDKYGGAIERFADDFDKLVMRMKSQWDLLLRDVGVSGPYGATKAFIKALTEEMKELRDSADWEKEAERIGANIMQVSETFALGTASVIDAVTPVLKSLYDLTREMWEGFRSLPRWVQEVGIIGALTLGSKGRLLIGASLFYLGWTKEQIEQQERNLIIRQAYSELGLPKVKDVRGFKVREVWPSPEIMEQRLRGFLGKNFDEYMRQTAQKYGFTWQGEGGSLPELKELQTKGGVTGFVARVFAKARENQEALKRGLQNIFPSGGKKPEGSGKGETGEGEAGLPFAESLKIQIYKDQAARIKRDLDLATLSGLERKLYLIDERYKKILDQAKELYQKSPKLFEQTFGSMEEFQAKWAEAFNAELDRVVNEWHKKNDKMAQYWEHTLERMQDTASDIFFDAMRGEIKSLGDVWNRMLMWMQRSVADYLGQLFTQKVTAPALSGLFGALGGLFGGGSTASTAGVSLLDVSELNLVNGACYEPGLAEGGIVTRPILRWLGEEGPEAVIPLNKFQAPLLRPREESRPVTVINYVYAMDAQSFEEFVRRNPGAIMRIMIDDADRNGPVTQAFRRSM